MTEVEELRTALEESVQLQAHYAKMLNKYDGGQRVAFTGRDQWIDRLREIKILPAHTTPSVGIQELFDELGKAFPKCVVSIHPSWDVGMKPPNGLEILVAQWQGSDEQKRLFTKFLFANLPVGSEIDAIVGSIKTRWED